MTGHPGPGAALVAGATGPRRLSRARIIAEVMGSTAPIMVIAAPAGMGKSWLIEDLASAVPETVRLVDLHHGGEVTPLVVPGPGQRLVIAKRPETAVPGLARAEVYGLVARLPVEALLFSRGDLAELGDAETLFARTGGWP